MDQSDDSTTTGFPWWARLSLRYGAPTVLLVGVLYMNFRIMETYIYEMSKTIGVTQTTLAMHIKDSNDFSAIFAVMMQQHTSVLRAICVNQARTDEARERCVR